MMKDLPSSEKRKCFNDKKTARSSLSNVEYLVCAGESFLEKKANGAQSAPTLCCKTAPMWLADASVASDRLAAASG
jgi:hypothetical protein